jgi:acetyl-CoA synthetase
MSDVLHKDIASMRISPHLVDYESEREDFSWEYARALLDGLPGGGLNIAHEACDRHASTGRVAIRWLGKQGDRLDLTYRDLSLRSNRFAHLLRALEVKPGERLFVLCPRLPELYVAVLGALKAKVVVCPLFGAFGPEPIAQRLLIGDGRVLVTTDVLYPKRVAPIRDRILGLRHVLVIGERVPGTLDLASALERQPESWQIPHTDPEDPALLHFTSGTTGKPKGAVHVHAAALHHLVSARYALDLHEDDVFWCTADPGWVTGTSYGLVAPLVAGVTSVVDEAEFEVERWYRTLAEQQVSVWYTAPTAVRMMRRAGTDLARRAALPHLRLVASVGEPLDAESVRWGLEAFGLPIHDNWWQTETGGILIANFVGTEIRPGSMGRPLPGIEAAVVIPGPDGVLAPAPPDTLGEIAIRPGWPSMFRAYLGEEERYQRCFRDGWYLSGDLARRDADGFFWFVGRADDAIKTAGHLIGPFEVEGALLRHPAVAEAAAIGVPDPVAMEVIKAFVALRPGQVPTDALRRELLGHARRELGPAVAPREIAFVDALPKTRSGKILRRLLKARELGLPEGDLSTLEPDPRTP